MGIEAAKNPRDGGVHAAMFRLQFAGERPLDMRRGWHGNIRMIDRHVAGAWNVQECCTFIRNLLVPVGSICGGKAF